MTDSAKARKRTAIPPTWQALRLSPLSTSTLALAAVGLAPLFVSGYFASDVLARAMLLALVALSLDLAWGYGGILSLGQSAFFGIGAYAVAILTLRWSSSLAAPAGILLALVLPALLAVVVGWFVFHGASSVLYVAIVTLALPVLLSAVDLRIPKVTGGLTGLSGVPYFPWDSDTTTFYVLFVVLVAGVAALHWLVHSDFGRLLMAVRDNEQRARFLGYRTPAIRLVVFALSAAIAGLAGALYAPFNGFVSYDLLGLTLSTNAIVWVALGGRGTIAGPLLGALIVNILEPTLNRAFPGFWLLILGLVFIAVILLFPDGLYGILRGRRPLGAGLRVVAADAAQAPEGALAISARGLRLSFGSLAVLQGVDLTVATGTLHCLIGPNGAGKSSLINVVTGLLRPNAGHVAIEQEPLHAGKPDLVARRRIFRTFQASNVFETLTVGDNLLLARGAGRMASPFRRTTVLDIPPAAFRVLELSGLDAKIGERAGELGHGERKWLELSMVLAAEPAIIFLDEPTAGLSAADRNKAGEVLIELVRRHKLGLLLIEHDLDFVKSIAQRLTVLGNGRILSDGAVAAVIGDPKVQQIYGGGLGEVADGRGT
jgi:branched-chain amino acid transport system permease protein